MPRSEDERVVEAVVKCCRNCITGSISLIIVTCLAVWVFVGVDDPTSSIQSLYLPALNKTSLDSTTNATTPTNNTLFFEIKLSNGNEHWGIYYGGVNLTFYDNPNSTRSQVIGSHIIPRFYQGYHKKATKTGAVEIINTTLVSREFCSQNGYVVLRVEMETVIRFRINVAFKSKRKKLLRRANVVVNDQGAIVNEDGIELVDFQSYASKHNDKYCSCVGVFVSLMVFLFL